MHSIGALEPLTFAVYARLACKTDRFVGESDDSHYRKLSFGYFGEIGSLLSAMKKVSRDKLETTEEEQARIELGDALWYLTNLALLCGVTGNQLAETAYSSMRLSLQEGPGRNTGPVHFNQFHGLASIHEARLVPRKEALLRQAGSQAGYLVSLRFEQLARGRKAWARALLGDCLAQIVLLCGSFKLRLTEVAKGNIQKIFDRWPADASPAYAISPQAGKPWEQFAAKYSVTFEERPVGGRAMVVQQIRGVNVGDPLTDNMLPSDGYRFHDVFHLSYAAHLGWSPVIRALLKLKRKSRPEIDENQDGARAIIIEEGIATWIFNDAKRRHYYRYIGKGRLDLAILMQVRSMVQGFEVKDIPLWQWEMAILDGFKVFRELLANKGGIVHADLVNHTLQYERLPRTTPST